MQIVDDVSRVPFKDIKLGYTFRNPNGITMMKIPEYSLVGGTTINAIRLVDGIASFYRDDVLVRTVEAVVTVRG